MTIEEAAELVIQAGAMADGGEVFLLDMGESVKIYDLAVKMINFSGLQLKDKKNPNGDIEIIITGLRPGEKLYEELLIEDNSLPTKHPKIFKAQESFVPWNQLRVDIQSLKEFIFENNQIIFTNHRVSFITLENLLDDANIFKLNNHRIIFSGIENIEPGRMTSS